MLAHQGRGVFKTRLQRDTHTFDLRTAHASHCPTQRQYFAAIAHVRCAESGYLPVSAKNLPHSTKTIQARSLHPARCAHQNPAETPSGQTDSTDIPADNRRNHRCGCQAAVAIPWECCRHARWSGRKCSVAHQVGKGAMIALVGHMLMQAWQRPQ